MEDVDWILWSESEDAHSAYRLYRDDAMHSSGAVTFDTWLRSDDAQRSYWEATV